MLSLTALPFSYASRISLARAATHRQLSPAARAVVLFLNDKRFFFALIGSKEWAYQVKQVKDGQEVKVLASEPHFYDLFSTRIYRFNYHYSLTFPGIKTKDKKNCPCLFDGKIQVAINSKQRIVEQRLTSEQLKAKIDEIYHQAVHHTFGEIEMGEYFNEPTAFQKRFTATINQELDHALGCYLTKAEFPSYIVVGDIENYLKVMKDKLHQARSAGESSGLVVGIASGYTAGSMRH